MELCEKPHFFCSILKVKKLRYTVFERGDSSLHLLLFRLERINLKNEFENQLL